MRRRSVILAGPAALLAARAAGAAPDLARAADAYLQPYVDSGNFSGVARIERDGRVLFERAYGFADRAARTPNRVDTAFHVASVSMQLTAAAVMRLVDQGSVGLDAPIGDLAGPAARAVTVRNLLTERSGLPDINARDDYGEILKRHQTPASLVGVVAGQPLLFAPGSKRLHEEHSAYNALALLVEQKTGRPFREAMAQLVFAPLRMVRSGVDDDAANGAHFARPHQPTGVFGVEPAAPIHWSGKAGNASAYVTAADHARWMAALFDGDFLTPASRAAVLDATERSGFGWFKSDSKRFGGLTYYMNGRAPGFASFVLRQPQARLSVIVFSNLYSSATTTLGYDLADLAMGKTPAPFRAQADAAWQEALVGSRFRFGADFYQPNIVLNVVRTEGGVALEWPGGGPTALIPTAPDRFTDRSYWVDVAVRRGADGQPVGLDYDGRAGVRA